MVISGYLTDIALNKVIGIRVSSESRIACNVELLGVAVMQSTEVKSLSPNEHELPATKGLTLANAVSLTELRQNFDCADS